MTRQRSRLALAATALMATFLVTFSSSTVRADAAADQYKKASTHYLAGEYALAAVGFQDFLTKYSSHSLADASMFFMGESYVQTNRPGDALGCYEQFLRRAGPQHQYARQALFRIGEASYMTGRYPEAKKIFEEFHRLYPNDLLDQFVLPYEGRMALVSGDNVGAARAFDAAIERFPNAPQAAMCHFGKGRLLLREKKFDAAVPVFEKLLRQANNIPANRQNPSQQQVDLGEVQYMLALAHLGAGRCREAYDALATFQTKDRTNDFVAEVYAARASALVGMQQYNDAVAPLQRYLTLAPRGPNAPRCRAELVTTLASAGRFDEALAAWRNYTTTCPKHPMQLATTEILAEKAFRAGKTEMAKTLYTELTRRTDRPEYVARGRRGLAWSQLNMSDLDGSSATFYKLWEDFPESPLAMEAAMTRGHILAGQKKNDQALVMFHWIIDNPQAKEHWPKALWQAAQVHARLGQNREAHQMYGRILREYPRHEQTDMVLYNQSFAAAQVGRPAESRQMLQRIMDDWPDSRYWPEATYRLAEDALEQEEYDNAQRLVEELLQDKTPSPFRRNVRLLKGRIAMHKGRWEEVLSEMDQLASEVPPGPMRLTTEYWGAEACYRLERWDDASKRFNQLSQQTQGRKDSWIANIELRRLQVAAHKSQWDDVLAIAEKIPGRFPNFHKQYEVDYQTGLALVSKAKFNDARAAYQRVIQSPAGAQTETATKARCLIGETYIHQRQYNQAITEFSHVLTGCPFPKWTAFALLQTGKCYQAKNMDDKAIEAWSRIIKDYLDTGYSHDAARLLKAARQRQKTQSNEKR